MHSTSQRPLRPAQRAALTLVLMGVIALSCVTLGSTAANAQAETDPAGYRQAVDQAVAEFARRNFEEARALFARADALFSSARTQRGLGLADFELRSYAECIRHLERALHSQVRPLDANLRADTEQLLVRAKTFVGRYIIQAEPSSAKLVLDGYPTQLERDHVLWLKPGEHGLELEAPAYQTERRRLLVHGGEQALLRFKLVPAHQESKPDAWYESPWFWGATGVIALSITTVIVIAMTSGGKPSAKPDGGSSGVVLGALSLSHR